MFEVSDFPSATAPASPCAGGSADALCAEQSSAYLLCFFFCRVTGKSHHCEAKVELPDKQVDRYFGPIPEITHYTNGIPALDREYNTADAKSEDDFFLLELSVVNLHIFSVCDQNSL